MAGENIYQVAFNSISAHAAIIDESGVIIETNRAWQDFARENDFNGPADCVGINYLAICDSVMDPGGETAGIAAGIRQVMEGKQEEYFARYPCHSPRGKRWYALRAVRFRAKGKRQVVITHENITPIMLAQASLERKEQELREQAHKLEETNIALRVLLERRDQDRLKLEETILVNVKELVLPYIEKLLAANLSARELTLLEIAESRLRDIISPFMGRLSAVNNFLTPQEIQVATHVRDAKNQQGNCRDHVPFRRGRGLSPQESPEEAWSFKNRLEPAYPSALSPINQKGISSLLSALIRASNSSKASMK